MTNSFEYKGHTYTFSRGWGRDNDIDIVKTFLDNKKLPNQSYCVIIHDGPDPDKRNHEKVITFSGLKTYWGPIIHRGPYFSDELGNVYQIFISHCWEGKQLTSRQKKHIREEFESFAYKMRNVKAILFFYQDEVKTERHKLRFSFYNYSGDEEDKKVLKAFKYNKSLPDISYCAIKYDGTASFSEHNLLFRHDTNSTLVYDGPAFHDDEGNDYEIIVSRDKRNKKLTSAEQTELQKAFEERASKKSHVDFIEYHWQTAE